MKKNEDNNFFNISGILSSDFYDFCCLYMYFYDRKKSFRGTKDKVIMLL